MFKSDSISYNDLHHILPSQLYLNVEKLKVIEKKFVRENGKIDLSQFKPIPIKQRAGKVFYTDGHHRAFFAYKHHLTKIPIEWDKDDLDWELYDICIQWCIDAKIQ